MVVPLLPFYATRMGANGFTYTILVLSFSLAILISAPLWGGSPTGTADDPRCSLR